MEILHTPDDGDCVTDFFSSLKRDVAASQESILTFDDENKRIPGWNLVPVEQVSVKNVFIVHSLFFSGCIDNNIS